LSATSKFSVYGRMTAQPGQRANLIERFRDVLRLGIPGLEWCSISAAIDDPDTIWITQIWADRAAHDTGTRSGTVAAATVRVMALVAGSPEGSYGEVVHLLGAPGELAESGLPPPTEGRFQA
jgi:heme-degrading monooxygenase HmoA